MRYGRTSAIPPQGGIRRNPKRPNPPAHRLQLRPELPTRNAPAAAIHIGVGCWIVGAETRACARPRLGPASTPGPPALKRIPLTLVPIPIAWIHQRVVVPVAAPKLD